MAELNGVGRRVVTASFSTESDVGDLGILSAENGSESCYIFPRSPRRFAAFCTQQALRVGTAGLFNLLSEWGTVGVILAAELAAEQPSTERCFSMISPLLNSCVIGPFSRTLLSPHQRVKHCISCQFNTIQEIDDTDGEDESAQ